METKKLVGIISISTVVLLVIVLVVVIFSCKKNHDGETEEPTTQCETDETDETFRAEVPPDYEAPKYNPYDIETRYFRYMNRSDYTYQDFHDRGVAYGIDSSYLTEELYEKIGNDCPGDVVYFGIYPVPTGGIYVRVVTLEDSVNPVAEYFIDVEEDVARSAYDKMSHLIEEVSPNESSAED